MKFYRVDHQTVMSGKVVRYKPLHDDRAQISASRDGVYIAGLDIISAEARADFQSVLDRAFVQHEHIRQEHRARMFGSGAIEPLPFDGDPECVVDHRKEYFGRDNYEVIASREPQEAQ